MSHTEPILSEPYLLVEKCGSQRGNPIYVITKYSPSVSLLPNVRETQERLQSNRWIPNADSKTSDCDYVYAVSNPLQREIRCMDLGAEAFGTYKALQGGCSQIQASADLIVQSCF
jgi:hypothetical protein